MSALNLPDVSSVCNRKNMIKDPPFYCGTGELMERDRRRLVRALRQLADMIEAEEYPSMEVEVRLYPLAAELFNEAQDVFGRPIVR